jgi:hypothetical protein
VAQVVEHLPSKHEALNSNAFTPYPPKYEKDKKETTSLHCCIGEYISNTWTLGTHSNDITSDL